MPNILSHLNRRERFAPMLEQVRQQVMTLRQLIKWIAQSGFIVAGTPENMAERIALWYQQRAVDRFAIMPPWPGVADVFFTQVVPLLQERGIFREEYASDTLRGHLGLV